MKIAVYNPISGHGHLDSWNAMIVQALRDHGHEVVAFTAGPAALSDLLDKRGVRECAHLRVVELRRRPKRLWWQRVGRFFMRSGRDVGRWIRWALQGHVRRSATEQPGSNAVLRPRDIAVNVLMVDAGRDPPHLVLILYMDLFSRQVSAWAEYDSITDVPWVGIQFHVPPPGEAGQEGWLLSRQFRGLSFLVEETRSEYQRMHPRKTFGWLPEITTRELCPNGDIVAALRRQARGRKVIFYGGSIGRSKNISVWRQVVAAMEPSEWFFCLIGEVHDYDLSPEDRIALDAVRNETPENVFIHPYYVGDDCVFNTLIAEADVVYAVYRDFPHSSNMIAKAGWLGKPIVVSNRHLMGERVQRYGLGATVAETDPVAIANAIAEVCRHPPPQEAFLAYQAECNEHVFGTRLSEWLHACMAGPTGLPSKS